MNRASASAVSLSPTSAARIPRPIASPRTTTPYRTTWPLNGKLLKTPGVSRPLVIKRTSSCAAVLKAWSMIRPFRVSASATAAATSTPATPAAHAYSSPGVLEVPLQGDQQVDASGSRRDELMTPFPEDSQHLGVAFVQRQRDLDVPRPQHCARRCSLVRNQWTMKLPGLGSGHRNPPRLMLAITLGYARGRHP